MGMKPTWLPILSWDGNEELYETKKKPSWMTDLFLSPFCEGLVSGSATCTGENCQKGILEGHKLVGWT